MKISLISLIFLKWSLVFPIILFSSISLHWSLKAFLSLLAILWNSAFTWVYLSFSPLLFMTWVRSLCWEDSLEKETSAHSSTVAWKILWMENPGRLQSMGLQRVGHDWATSLHFTLCHKSGVICISEIIDISPGNLDSSLCFLQPSVSHDVLCIEVQ